MEKSDQERLETIKKQYLGYVAARHRCLSLTAETRAHPSTVKPDDLWNAEAKEKTKLGALMVTLGRLFPLKADQSVER